MPEEEKGLTLQDWKGAIGIQDACNLSGIVHAFSDVITRIWVTAHENGEGTEWVNTHPICLMYLDKFAQLSKYHTTPLAGVWERVNKVIKKGEKDGL